MAFEPFLMERMQSIWENQVRYNLSESGVHPMTLGELLDPQALCGTRLGYPQTNGSIETREAIAALYPGATRDHVILTNGTAEANFITLWSLVEPGDEIVMMVPNYMQIWGAARTLGAGVKTFPLVQEGARWRPDLDALGQAVTSRTRLIAVCNPNNPTGAVLTQEEMSAVCGVADKVGTWILADEVYRGAERTGVTTPSFWGRYERALAVCGLSKAYGLPGLRIGWAVGPTEKIAELWGYKDYTTIAPSMLSDRLARLALSPGRHSTILQRTRAILRSHYPIVEQWLMAHTDLFTFVPPQAGAIVYVEYHLDVNSTALIDRLRVEKSVLIVPGDHFGMDHFVRIGFGGDPEGLTQGLALFAELLGSIRP